MKRYSLTACESLIEKYTNNFGGKVATINEGVLGLGTVILHRAEGKKSIVIQEHYLNDWSSYHTIRRYNILPKKYENALEKF